MSRPLHIAIDARWIFTEISGIGSYTQELIAALAGITSPHRYTVIFNHPDVMARTITFTKFDKNPAFETHLVSRGPFSPSDQWALPRELKKMNADIFHSTNYMMPFWFCGGIKRVVTMHDLIPLLFRDHAPRSKKNRLFPVFKWIMNTAAAKSDMIITVSDSTRRDVSRHLKIPAGQESKIRVIHEGVRAAYVPAERKPHDETVFLFVGRRDPYKNLPMLIQALADVRRDGLPAHLRVVGGDDPRYPEARELSASLGVDDHITWSGYVPDNELISAYQQADVFVLPSKYEGFGLPVLESMACGTPVICSNTSSLPEVAGDAALMIDIARPRTLADAMKTLIAEPETRNQFSQKGLARAAKFSWEETARKTIAAYESLW
jgi:alpha-1,3-rhamnosyl/mannosyltransferase